MGCLVMLSLGMVADACDVQGMTQCNTDYSSSARATGTQVCDAVSTLATCMNSKGEGCDSAALAQFNSMVSNAKAPLCTATGTCANHTLCTGGLGSSVVLAHDGLHVSWCHAVSRSMYFCVCSFGLCVQNLKLACS